MMKTTRITGLAVAALLASGAYAQDITSADGEWRATLDSNGTGQITNLFNLGGSTDNLFETLWYEASDFTGGLTQRVENIYTNTSSVIGADSASFALMRVDGLIRLDVNVNMISGANGGARFDLTWTNMGPTSLFKPFAYADLDVAASAGGDSALYDASIQSIVQSDDGVDIFFGGTQDYKSWEIDTFADLRTALDGGRSQLLGAGGGSEMDFTAALSGAEALLFDEDSLTFTFQIGGRVPAPGALALLGFAGLAGTRRRR
jgi:hypothetical protein